MIVLIKIQKEFILLFILAFIISDQAKSEILFDIFKTGSHVEHIDYFSSSNDALSACIGFAESIGYDSGYCYSGSPNNWQAGWLRDPNTQVFHYVIYNYPSHINILKNKGSPDYLSCQGNPINSAIGNKYQEESDYTPSGASPLAFVRSYNGFDGYWRHSFSAHLKISASSIALVHADGKETPFALSGGIATPDADELGSLVQNGSEWVYTSPEQAVSRFDSTGRLLEWRNAQGISYSLSYGTTRTVVTDSFGNTLSFTQDSDYQPLSLEVGDVSVAYAYDARARLIQLTRTTAQGSLTRTFHYENASYPRFLTGITDERGVRYATWTYDDQGRAISSEHAGGAEKTTLSYNADGSTTVTNELGKQTVYHYDVFLGVKKVVSIQGEPSANCPASNSTYTYNDRGQVLTKTDANGNVTQYSYNDRGLEVSRTEGYGTAETRTVTTEWDASRFLPVKVVEAGRTTTYSYDSQGRLLSQKTTVN